MAKFTVSYYDRYPLDPKDRFEIHREVITADTKREAGDIMAYCGKEVIGVDESEQPAAEAADIADWLAVGELPTQRPHDPLEMNGCMNNADYDDLRNLAIGR